MQTGEWGEKARYCKGHKTYLSLWFMSEERLEIYYDPTQDLLLDPDPTLPFPSLGFLSIERKAALYCQIVSPTRQELSILFWPQFPGFPAWDSSNENIDLGSLPAKGLNICVGSQMGGMRAFPEKRIREVGAPGVHPWWDCDVRLVSQTSPE